MKSKLSKREVLDLLYKAFKKENRRLLVKELKEVELPSKTVICRILEVETLDKAWEMMEDTYKLPNYAEVEKEKERQELIRELNEISERLGRTAGKRDFSVKGVEKKAKRLFGSWAEFISASGRKHNAILSDHLTNSMKDKIFETLMIYKIINKKLPPKTKLTAIKNLPHCDTIERFTEMKWEELIAKDKLDLGMEYGNKVERLDDDELLKKVIDEVKSNKHKTLYDYTLKRKNTTYSYIYILNRLGITWTWLYELISNNMKCKDNPKFKIDKNILLDILALKLYIYERPMKSFEIDADICLPNTLQIMSVLGVSNMMDTWKMAESRLKEML